MSSLGFAMLAFGILAVRGAYIFVRVNDETETTVQFLTGQIFAVIVTGLIATGPILFASALLDRGIAGIGTFEYGLDLAIIAVFVVVWFGFNRFQNRIEPRPAGTVTSMAAKAPAAKAPRRRAA